MLKKNLIEVLNGYLKYDIHISPPIDNIRKLLTKTIPEILHSGLQLSSEYKVRGTVGIGAKSEIPLIAILDKSITNSPQEGFYVVILFQADMSGFYISLNQGWTQYANKYDTKTAREEIFENALIAFDVLKIKYPLEIIGFDRNIELNGRLNPSKGNEKGNIVSKYYQINSIKDDQSFLNDIAKFIDLYSLLKDLIGKNIMLINTLDKLDDDNEDLFQEFVQASVSIPYIPDGPISKPSTIYQTSIRRFPRNPKIAKQALINAKFECENDPKHQTFIYYLNGKNFIEAHHIIPIEYEERFSNSIDVPENIIGLCPNCHKAFHCSEPSERKRIIEIFYRLRYTLIKSRGIEIDLKTLLTFYGINN